jgi:uncharacterized repeat protein (TIGR01451 family)
MRALVVTAALLAAGGAAASLPAMAQPASAQGQRVVESRVVSVRGDQVLMHDGTTLKIPSHVANPLEIEEGDTVRFTYEVRNGQNVATSIQFRDRPSGGMRRRY